MILGICALVALCWAPSILQWWSHPIAVMFGRRDFWWDAEDFAVFYAAGTLLSRGDAGQLYDTSSHALIQMPILVDHDEPLGFYNPPFFALFFVPFAGLSPERAFQVWTAVNAALALLVCAMLWRIAAPLDRAYRALIIAGFLTLYPLTFGLRLGQFSLVLAASWAAAYLYLRHGRGRAAGYALAPLLIKPELLIPITLAFAWKRRGEALRSLIPVTCGAIAASVVIVGPAGAWDYAAHVAGAATDGSGNMYGWNGLLASVFAPGDPGSVTPISVPLALVSLAGAAWLWRGAFDPTSDTFPTQWLALTLATVLWDVHFYLQDVIILAPPAVAVLATSRGGRQAVTAAAMLAGWIILAFGSRPSEDWGFNIFTAFAAVCLTGIVAAQVVSRRRHRRAVAETMEETTMIDLRAA